MPTQRPLGLGYLAAVLEKAGHEVKIFDCMVEEGSAVDYCSNFSPELVGISANTPLIKSAWEIASEIKKKGNSFIVLGGPHPTALPEESLKLPYIDAVVRGEGEETVLELVEALAEKKGLADISGLSFKEGDSLIHNPARPLNNNLDTLPWPAYHLYQSDKYSVTQPLRDRPFGKAKAFYLMTSRGCPYACSFCFKGIYGLSWRPRTPENVVAEWDFLVNKLGATEIGVQDDLFNFDKKRALRICDLLVEKNLSHVPWITNNGIRVNFVDEELLAAMKKAGCKRVAFGVESGDQRILDHIHKKITLEMVRKAFTAAKKVGLETMGFFMFGNLGENEGTMEKTIQFALELDPLVSHFSVATPFPGTEFFQKVEKEGKFLTRNWDDYGLLEGRAVFERGEIKAPLLERKWHEAYRRFYLRSRRIFREIFKLSNWLNLPRLLKAGFQYFFGS
ncbi:MAG: radical SAM protein [Patescibacteria group bacterium]